MSWTMHRNLTSCPSLIEWLAVVLSEVTPAIAPGLASSDLKYSSTALSQDTPGDRESNML